MPLTSDLPSSSVKGRGGKVIAHARHPSVDGDPSQPKFPRIEDCAHFHYDRVDYGRIKVSLIEESSDGLRLNGSLNFEGFNPAFNVRITCKDNTWVVRRTLAHFGTLDSWLHECVFDRKFSHLPELNIEELTKKILDDIHSQLRSYLSKLSSITGVENGEVQIFCAPVLIWLEVDNLGRNLAPHALGDVADINIPAIAAARVVRRYQARDDDELNLDVGDMVSIIEMGVSGWWRGKQGLRVGSFPSQCVRRINSATDAVGTHGPIFTPPAYGGQLQEKPIVRKHGKFMDFLRSFLDTRPSKAHLKKKGILRERVFGCDLGELLHRTDEDIPTIVTDCTRFVEKYGIVDGIYRISGGSSHIRHLKYEFDSDRRPDLENQLIDIPNVADVPGMAKESSLRCDPHSVAGLCKLYFRELPNPLLTYQLYNRLASAVTDYDAEDRLLKVHDVIQQLPPPHYRTLKHLITHLRFMAQNDDRTSMHSRNLAIVWAPNLLRSREIEAGLAAYTEARVQSVVTEFLIMNGDLLFSEELQTIQYDAEHKPPRPRSLMIVPTPKLISLEEAQARSKSGVVTPVSQQNTLLESSMSGVRLRNPQEKSLSNEKRKRHKKAPSTVTIQEPNSPHPTRSSKKQGHRHATSCTEPTSSSPKGPDNTSEVDTPTPSSGAQGWKVKLGFLLRKNTPQCPLTPKQGSLRRAKSYDSFIFGHDSLTKVTDGTPEFSKKLLNRAKSCEDTGVSDRSHPEPQVPHLKDFSPVLSESRKYTLERLKSSLDDEVGHSESRARCSSPFCTLDTEFPNVMDENGLDFDPLSYRLTNPPSPSREGSMQAFRKFSADFISSQLHDTHLVQKEITKQGIRPIKMPPLTDQFEETHLERPTTFRPIPDKILDNSFEKHQISDSKMRQNEIAPLDHQAHCNASDSTLSNDGSSASGPNESSNNNTMLSPNSKCNFENLTADSISFPAFSSTGKATRMSAAERLGLKKQKIAGLPVGILKKSQSTPKCENNQGWKIKQNIVVPTNFQNLKKNSGSSPTPQSNRKKEKANSRKISVQVYDLPSKGPLRRDDHYGSFIALVGSAVGKEDSSRKAEKSQVSVTSQSNLDNADPKPTYVAANSKAESKYNTQESSIQQGERYRIHQQQFDVGPDRGRSQRPHAFWHDPRPITVSARMYQTKLQTFSPAGKQRENYPDVPRHIPRFSTPNRSHIPPPPYDSEKQFRSKTELNSCSFPPKFQSYSPTPLSVYHQKHGRSYSVGDECSPEIVPQHHVTHRPLTSSCSQYSATSYQNRVYEDACLLYKSKNLQMETLSECSSSPFVESRAQISRLQCPRYPCAPSSGQFVSPSCESLSVSTPIPQSLTPRSRGASYSNPSYELRPIYYKGQGRYDFPRNRRKPTLITSVRDDSSSLSWV